MSDEELIGKVMAGDVTNITKFGAFVKLENNEVGLVHISQISFDYIDNIDQHIDVGQHVLVKILSRNKQGKLELSIKQASEKEAPVKNIVSIDKASNTAFEQKLSTFMKRAESKHIDLRRQQKKKQGMTKKQKKR